MLVLTREIGEAIMVGDNITITVLKGDGAQRCKLGVDAPDHVIIQREEVAKRELIDAEISSSDPT